MPDAFWSQAPGPTALPRRSGDMGHSDSNNSPKASRPSVGKPRSGGVNAPDASWHEANTPMGLRSPLPVRCAAFWGLWPRRGRSSRKTKTERHGPQHAAAFHADRLHGASAETQPRCGVTRGSVKRLDVHFASPAPVPFPGIAGLQPGSGSHARAWRPQGKPWRTGSEFMKQTSSTGYSSLE